MPLNLRDISSIQKGSNYSGYGVSICEPQTIAGMCVRTSSSARNYSLVRDERIAGTGIRRARPRAARFATIWQNARTNRHGYDRRSRRKRRRERERERTRKRSFFSRARSTGIVFSASFLAAESAAADREHFVPATSKTRAGTVLTKRGHVSRKSLSAAGRIVEARWRPSGLAIRGLRCHVRGSVGMQFVTIEQRFNLSVKRPINYL